MENGICLLWSSVCPNPTTKLSFFMAISNINSKVNDIYPFLHILSLHIPLPPIRWYNISTHITIQRYNVKQSKTVKQRNVRQVLVLPEQLLSFRKKIIRETWRQSMCVYLQSDKTEFRITKKLKKTQQRDQKTIGYHKWLMTQLYFFLALSLYFWISLNWFTKLVA